MESTISAQLEHINQSLLFLRSLGGPVWKQADFWGALLSSSVALGIALFIEPLRHWRLRPKLKIVRVIPKTQGGGLIIYRLLIRNVGKSKAEDVEITVEDLFEGNDFRDNFLAVPLGWTHASAYKGSLVVRDIHPYQSVYWDLCKFDPAQREGHGYTEPSLNLRAEAGNEVPDFVHLKSGRSRLSLVAYQANGRPTRKTVTISWDGKEEPVVKLR